jgi:hypothetical protein
MATMVALSSFAAGTAAPRLRAAAGLQHGAGASFVARSPPAAGNTALRRRALVVRTQNDPKLATKVRKYRVFSDLAIVTF